MVQRATVRPWVIAAAAFVALASPVVAEDDPFDPIRLFDDIDADGNGAITRAEVMERAGRLFDEFRHMARDTDGMLSRDEFQRGLGTMFGDGSHDDGHRSGFPTDPGTIFDQLDRDRDGRVTLEEMPDDGGREGLERWLAVRGMPAVGVDRAQFINFIDDVMSGPPGSSRPPRGSSPDEYGLAGDDAATDGEGLDMRDLTARQFDRLDTNYDGVVTGDEVPDADRPVYQFFLDAHGRTAEEGLTRDEFMSGLGGREQDRPHRSPSGE